MNATKRSVARAGFVVCGVLAIAVTGCRTDVVHERTEYVPAPPSPVVDASPATIPQAPTSVVDAAPAYAPQPLPPVAVEPSLEQSPVVAIRSENDFYEPLAAYGRWEAVGSYGRCWIPARVEAGWRPYSNGYWQRTDAGWYWASEEPWGWATYHYGRWDFHARFGWIWVPQTQWAPAWVAWREGGGYVGWAPLRPSVTIGVNIHVGDYEPAFASRAFVFVEHRRMLEPVRPQTVIVNNTTIINKTVNITKVKVVNKTVINEGPRLEVVERESGRKVQSVPAREFRHREEATVAARERNIPTANARKVQSPVRTEPQRAEKKTVPPPVARQAEKPNAVVTPSARPLARSVRPTPSQSQVRKPARDEKKHEAEIAKKFITTPPRIEPLAKLEVESAQAVPSRLEVRPAKRPAVAAKPTPQPVTTIPVHNEKQRESAVENRVTTATRAAESRSRNEVRPETRRETKLPVKVEPAPSSAVKKQIVPSSAKPSANRLVAPREKSRGAEPADVNKKKNEERNAKKEKNQEKEAAISPRQPQ